jgi:hypothetical protein
MLLPTNFSWTVHPNIMHSANEKDLDIVEQVAKLATASYLIAHIFCEARLANSQQSNDTDA